MATNFLLSLIAGGIAGAGLLFILLKYGYKWYKKEPIYLSGELIMIISILTVTLLLSAYTLGEISLTVVKKTIHYLQD